METIDKINAVLHAADYKDRTVLPQPEPPPQTATYDPQLAEMIAHRLWDDLLCQGGCANLDAHRFMSLTHVLDGVFRQHSHYGYADLEQLLQDLEKETYLFLNPHEPPFDNTLTPEAQRKIHHAIKDVVKPSLIKTITQTH